MNQNHKIIITIDGYSSPGKSTLAKKISNLLKYKYINTGAMYRAITLLAISNRIFNSDFWNIQNFIPVLRDVHFKFVWNNKLNKTDIFFK